jgi:hypothetical protein
MSVTIGPAVAHKDGHDGPDWNRITVAWLKGSGSAGRDEREDKTDRIHGKSHHAAKGVKA